MLNQLRQNIVQKLWENYCLTSPDMQMIKASLIQKGITRPALDHFAIIDLPGPHSGIPEISQIFSAIGYLSQGKDYLADKQNDFMWMAESDCMDSKALDVLPQVVIADFRLDEMPIEIRNIIYTYANQTRPAPLDDIETLAQRIAKGDTSALTPCKDIIVNYLSGRDWALPSKKEFHAVNEFNELLAWVLVFGRRPNHFTLSVHLLDHFTDLDDFHRFIEDEVKLTLNQEGGVLKGGEEAGIAQGSTSGLLQTVDLADGKIAIPTGFVEFVWRYANHLPPVLWKDYFTGFVASHADKVIESLYGN